MKRSAGHVGIAVATAALGACAVGPDFHAPAAPETAHYTRAPAPTTTEASPGRTGAAQTVIEERDIQADWWTLFHSASLNRLIEQSLRANPDLDAAQAALRQAQENLYAGEGALYPSANVSIQAEKQRFSDCVRAATRTAAPAGG